MKEWKEYKAADFCINVTDGTHDSPKPKEEGHYLITSKHLQNNDIDFSSAYRISEEDYLKVIQRSRVEQFDILFSMIGTIGNTVRVVSPEVDFAVKNMAIFKMGQNDLKSKWLYYWLKSSTAKSYISSRLAGSTQSYLTLDTLRNFPIYAPDERTMQDITAILSSIDDKIDLNNRINHNLEEQAQALYKSWFVDFEPFKGGKFVESELGMIPEGWSIATIESLSSRIASGGTPRSLDSSYYEGNIKWFTTKELKDCFLFDSEKHISDTAVQNSAAKFFPTGSVLMAIYASPTVGRLGILTEPSTFNQAAVAIIPQDNIGTEYVYMTLLSERDNLNNLASGAAQQNLNVGIVKNYQVIRPTDEIIMSFKTTAEPIFSAIRNNSKEIHALSALRDSLIPQLMSGLITC